VPPPLGTADAFAGTAPPRSGRPVVHAQASTARAVLAERPAPSRADGVELFGEVPGSGYRRPPTLVRRTDGQVVQLTPMLDAVVRELEPGRTYGQLAAAVGRRTGRSFQAEDVAFLVARLRPLGLLREVDGSQPELRRANPLLALRCRVVVSDPELTRRLTAPFAALFHPVVVAAVLVAFAASTGWLLFAHGLAGATYAAFSEPHLLLAVFALTVASAGFHEFGHAAACRYGGATPGAMGVGLYLVWPAFYTDVTDSYRLGRAGRLRVDLGGLYFNAVLSVATVAVWAITGWEALLLLVASQLLQMVRQLVPLVRFDGYHILADLTGVPDLFAHIVPTLKRLLPSGRRVEHPLKRWSRVVITTWVAIVVPVLVTVLVLLLVALPTVVATASDSLQVQWQVLQANWAAGQVAQIGVRLLSIAALLVPVLSALYLLSRIAARVARRVRAWTSGSRWRRSAAAGAGLLLGAALAATWVPGDHVPLGPDDDGGRVQDAIPFLPAMFGHERQDRPETQPSAAATAEAAAQPAARTAPRSLDRPASGPPSGPSPVAPVVGPEPAATSAPVGDRAAEGSRPGGTAGQPAPPSSGPGGGWPFPWDRPAPVRPGDDRAMVVNTRDGSRQRDVSLSLVWTEDERHVDTRNEAFAYASCRDCRSIAAAFQLVFVVGRSPVITPVNTAVAANYECRTCVTHAVANQLVVTLEDRPDGATQGQITRVLNQLRRTTATATSTAPILTAFRAAEAEILALLGDLVVRSEASDDVDVTEDVSGPDRDEEAGDVDAPAPGDETPVPGDDAAESDDAEADDAEAEADDREIGDAADDGVADDAASGTSGTPDLGDGSAADAGESTPHDGASAGTGDAATVPEPTDAPPPADVDAGEGGPPAAPDGDDQPPPVT
jgi:putative peptide zinc metalloprotease protein